MKVIVQEVTGVTAVTGNALGRQGMDCKEQSVLVLPAE